jgi:regulator of protease activity HflC (stomatin/prohibitin superfamily)
MEGAFAWLGKIFDWFGQFVPQLVIVDTTHGAVKFVRGKKIVACKPGLHVFWPLVTTMVKYPTARQGVDLRTQTLVTKDGKTIVAGGMIMYEVRDIELILAHTYDPDETIREIALAAIHDTLAKMLWMEIRGEQESGRLQRRLRQRLRRDLAKYGVHVIRATLTDLATTRVLKLLQSNN